MKTVVMCNVDGVSFHNGIDHTINIGPSDKITIEEVENKVVALLAQCLTLDEDEVKHQLHRTNDILNGDEYSSTSVPHWSMAAFYNDSHNQITMSLIGAIQVAVSYLRDTNRVDMVLML